MLRACSWDVGRTCSKQCRRARHLPNRALQEAERLQRQKRASQLQAQRSRAAAATYATRQAAAAAAACAQARAGAAAAAAAAAAGVSQARRRHTSTHIDYRFTRIHDLGPQAAAAAAAAAAEEAAAPAFAVAPRSAGARRQLEAELARLGSCGTGGRGTSAAQPFTIVRYSDYLQHLQAKGRDLRGACR